MRSQHSSSSRTFSVGLRSVACAGHSSVSTPSLANHVFMDLMKALLCWNKFGPFSSTDGFFPFQCYYIQIHPVQIVCFQQLCGNDFTKG